MKKFRITATCTVDRIYEVEADSEREAWYIYHQYDDRTKKVGEKDIDSVDTPLSIEEVKNG